MKKFFLTAMVCCSFSALFAEVIWQAASIRDFERRYARAQKDGTFLIPRGCWLVSKKYFPVDTAKRYRISCEIKAADEKAAAQKSRIGVIARDFRKLPAIVSGVKPIAGTETEVVAIVGKSDKVIKVKDASKWQKTASLVAYDADPSGQMRDIPNFDFADGRPVSWEKKGDVWEITLHRPAGVELYPGTVIRQHHDARRAIFSTAKKLSTDWRRIEFVIIPGVSTDGNNSNKFFSGAAFASPMVTLPANVFIRNFKYEIVE